LDSSGQLDFNFGIKPDVCVYSKDSTRRGPTDVARVECMIEFKWHTSDDPFCDPHHTNGENSFLRDGKLASDTAGQITAYAAAQFGSQFRTCVYSVLIVKSYARLIRWDRTGAVVSEPIEYNREGHLVEFFRRYHKASPKLRGVDTTVTVPTPVEAQLARECLELEEVVTLVKIAVPSPSGSLQFVTIAPTAPCYTPPGRATRGFVAYDLARKMKIFLKDSWRVDLPDMEKEGDTYQLL